MQQTLEACKGRFGRIFIFQQDNDPKHTAKARQMVERQQGECSRVAKSNLRPQSNRDSVARLFTPVHSAT